ncbi:uncharacterized protein METZ01_LOCUS150593, partial [marine metagenome]
MSQPIPFREKTTTRENNKVRVGTHGMMQVDYEQRIDFDRMR